MMRQSSCRNHRAKGLRMKSVLQICLLTAVCFWLLYQLKHSLDKKWALEDVNSRMLINRDGSSPDFLKLGRKDLPHAEVTASGHEANTQNEDDKDDVDEEEADRAVRRAVENGKVAGAVDDGIDEQDHERDEEQEDQDQERGDEDPEIGDDAINEDKDEPDDEMGLLDDQEENEDSEHGAREESYKKDDASSAVHRENQEIGSEDKADNWHEEQEENLEEKVVDMEHLAIADGNGPKDNNSSVAGALEGNESETISGTNLMINETVIEKRGPDFVSNNSAVSITDSRAELQTNSTKSAASETEEKLQINLGTAITTNQTETQTSNSSLVNDTAVPVQNETLSNVSVAYNKIIPEIGTLEENRPHLNTVLEELAEKPNITAGHDNLGEHSTVSLAMNENGEATESESARSSHRVVTEEEKEARSIT